MVKRTIKMNPAIPKTTLKVAEKAVLTLKKQKEEKASKTKKKVSKKSEDRLDDLMFREHLATVAQMNV